METAAIFFPKNLIDRSKESFTTSEIINLTGKEFVLPYYGLFCVFLSPGQSFIFLFVLQFVRLNCKTNKISSMFQLYYAYCY